MRIFPSELIHFPPLLAWTFEFVLIIFLLVVSNYLNLRPVPTELGNALTQKNDGPFPESCSC